VLGDTNRSPEIVVSMVTCSSVAEMETEGETYFFFPEALMKGLAESC
jgi:hypothetical protein